MMRADAVSLTYGGGRLDRIVSDAGANLAEFRSDIGIKYYEYVPRTSSNEIAVEDLGVTLLLNSRADSQPAVTLAGSLGGVCLEDIRDTPLAGATPGERQRAAELIAELARLPGFAASLATKLLHKKRPALIPVLDNQAIFGAYMNPNWPAKKASIDSVKTLEKIRDAIDLIHFDLNRSENRAAWLALAKLAPGRTRIEVFDMVWWINFRRLEPV